MSLGELYQIFQMIVGTGLGAILLGFFYHQKRILQERDRLLAEQKREKLKNDEKSIGEKFDSMSRNELLKSAEDIARAVDKNSRDDN